MVALSVQGALVNRFQDHQPEVNAGLDVSDYIQTRHNLIDLTEEGNKRGIQILVGMGSIEEMGGALRGANAVAAALQNQRKEEEERKALAKRRQLQALLDELAVLDVEIAEIRAQIAVLDEEIDHIDTTIEALNDGSLSVEDALQDPRIAEIVRRSGQTIDPNDPAAKDALIAILAAQRNDLNGQRSELEGQLDRKLERRSEIEAEITAIDADASLSVAQKQEAAAVHHSQGFDEAFTVAEVSTTDAVVSDASNAQDDHRQVAFGENNANVSHSSDELNDLFGDESALDFASANFGNQFASASPPPEDAGADLAIANDPKLENAMG